MSASPFDISFDELIDLASVNFNAAALKLFHFQAQNNSLYATYLDHRKVNPSQVTTLEAIPFLPISFFKTKTVKTGGFQSATIFKSSGTTGSDRSTHHLSQTNTYSTSYNKTFRMFYGDPADYTFIALLPNYQEQSHSSLIHMVDDLIGQGAAGSGYFLNEPQTIKACLANAKKPFIIGVTYALLDLAEQHAMDLSKAVVMETGGMKGRRKEITRSELHGILCEAFNLKSVHSEYGMTELLSQGYSHGEGIFNLPPWMKLLVRNPNDPYEVKTTGSGGGNIIDLANIESCAFIETQDLCTVNSNGSFEVIGRFDHSDIRGCNLLVI